MGTLWAPIFKNKILNLALQDSNLHFDVMNIKFYLLSQEFAAGDTCWWGGAGDGKGGMWWEGRHVVGREACGGKGGMWWEGAGDGVGGHDVATTCSLQTPAHFAGTPP